MAVGIVRGFAIAVTAELPQNPRITVLVSGSWNPW